MTALLIAAAVGLLVGAAVIASVALRHRQRGRQTKERYEAMASFNGERPSLAEKFIAAAAATGKPRGLRWKGCDLGGEPVFGVEKKTGLLCALIGATISFEAIEGGGMEDVEAVSNLRSSTAVFVHRGGEWTTDGRVVFNLDPAATLERFGDSLVVVEQT